MQEFKAENDGVDHVNIYSKAKTELGQLMSNFAHTPFVHPLYGKFSSLEAFWYWFSTGRQYDELRTTYGFMAKKKGQRFGKVPMDEVGFRKEIIRAIKIKAEQTPRLKELLKECKLPFTHYYNFGGKIVYPKDQVWQVNAWDFLRKSYQKGWIEGISIQMKKKKLVGESNG